MREAQLEAACVKYAKSRGWLHAKLDPKGNIGVPDHVFFGPGGRTLVVEFKTLTGKLSAKQEAFAAAMLRQGFMVRVVRAAGEFRYILDLIEGVV